MARDRFTAAALAELRFVADPRLDPEGRRAAAVVTEIVPGEGDDPPRYRSRIHLFELDDGAGAAPGDGRILTRSAYADTQPRFSPDGRWLAFVSRREARSRPQLYRIALAGGEAEALTDLPAGVDEAAWLADGSLVLASRGAWRDEAGERGTPRTIDRLRYKLDGTGFLPGAPAQLWRLEPGADPEKLTDLPTSVSGLAVAPDGRSLVFLAAPDLASVDEGTVQVWRSSRKGRRRRALLPEPMLVSAPAIRPDGREVAFLAPADPDNSGSPTGLWTVPLDGGAPILRSAEFDAAPSIGGDTRYGSYPNRPHWIDDDRLLINLNRGGRSGLAVVTRDGEVTPLDERERAVTAFHAAAGRVLLVAETPERPGELVVTDAAGGERRVSGLNDAVCDRYRFVAASPRREVETDDGTPLGYWTLEPERPRDDRAVVLQVHGGPHTNYGYGFYHEFQLLAAAGYTVVYGNPRGGSSFGTAFATTLQGRYGTVDASDVLAILDHALATLRRKRAPVHLTGGSYGGFMTNWLVGTSDRFTSAVTQRSICNWLSFYGSSDIGYRFSEREVQGTPWTDPERLWEQSPLRHVANVRTPLLILHAEQDHRCPVEQAEQLFVALKRIGRAETELIRFPDEGHELSRSGRPDRRIARLEAIVGWFERHAPPAKTRRAGRSDTKAKKGKKPRKSKRSKKAGKG